MESIRGHALRTVLRTPWAPHLRVAAHVHEDAHGHDVHGAAFAIP